MSIVRDSFGCTAQGREVARWTLSNSAGMSAEILSWGCVVRALTVPDRDGSPTDVVLGFDDMAGYERGSCFYGAFVGRYANRIRGAAFRLNGRQYELAKNDGNNHLHGAFCSALFQGETEGDTLCLRRHCPATEEGYPGALEVQVRYRLTDGGALSMEYIAASDADTVVNLTNHSYFNLAGEGRGDILDHTLQLRCDRFTECDSETLPTGRVLTVEGTPMDFTREKPLGREIFADDPQLTQCRGYDHNLIFSPGASGALAEAWCPRSGIVLSVHTSQPAVQLYTGNYIDSDTAPAGKGGTRYPRYGGFCLETQHYPCSPNFPQFPTTVLRAGQTYRETTVYTFGVRG